MPPRSPLPSSQTAPPSSQPTPSSSSRVVATQDGVALKGILFNPVGIRRLRAFLGEGDIYERFKHRFDMADMAWFIAGTHKDGTHSLPPDRFHKQYLEARIVNGNDADAVYWARREFRDQLRDLVWDAVTMLDRVTGGASFLVHCPGTVEPGQREELAALKLDVYIPPFILHDNPLIDRPLACMIQTFAEEVALPVTHRWRRAFKATKIMRKDQKIEQDVELPSHLPLMPDPQQRTTLYRCRGRCEGELEEMLANAADDTHPRDRDGPARRDGYAARHTRATASDEELAALRAQIAQMEAIISEKQREIVMLQDVIKDRDGDIVRLEQAVQTCSRQDMPRPTAHASMRAATPSRAGPTTPSVASPVARSFRQATASTPARSTATASSPVAMLSRTPAPSPAPTPTTPLSTRLSAMSMSPWLLSSGSSRSLRSPSPPRQLPAHLDWEMPSPPSRLSHAPVATAPSTPAQASSSDMRAPMLTRFDIIGPTTQAALDAAHLPATLHRTLQTIVYHQPQSRWRSILVEELHFTEEVAAQLVFALEEDIPAQ